MTALTLTRSHRDPVVKVALSGYQRVLLRVLLHDMANGMDVSYTFAPGNVRHMLHAMKDKRVCQIVTRTFEGDTQVYEFAECTPYGKQVAEGAK